MTSNCPKIGISMSKTDVDCRFRKILGSLVKLYTKVEINDDGGRKLSNILEYYLAYFSVRNASTDNVQWTHSVSKLFLNDHKNKIRCRYTTHRHKMSGN